MNTNNITVETTIKSNMQTVWDAWTKPEHITKWLHASEDWECPHAENDLRAGGAFLSRMGAKDKSISFDVTGTYTAVEHPKLIAYTMADGRNVSITFSETPEGIHVVETFDAEHENSEEVQQGGWQAILTNFKNYVERIS